MIKKIAFLLAIVMLAASLSACLTNGNAVTTTDSSQTGDADMIDITTEVITHITTEPITEPVTEPPVTEPPATEPPVTEPPATEPPATEPPVTEPPATEPPATEPPATEPPVTEPPVTEPPATEPPVTEPPETEPVIIDDGIIDGAAYSVKNTSLVALGTSTYGQVHGEAVKLVSYCGDLDQLWRFFRQKDGTYKIQNASTGYYLSVTGKNVRDGAAVSLYTSASNQGQRWRVIPEGKGFVLKCEDTNSYLSCSSATGVGFAIQRTDKSHALVFALDALVSPDTELPQILPLKGAIGAPGSCPEVIKYNGKYYCINMHTGMWVKSSKDLITWTKEVQVYPTKPAWIKDELGSDSIWAPGFYTVGGKLYIYYCSSTSGSRNSVIGLTECVSPLGPFTDKGMVMRSYKDGADRTPYNCIDPNIFTDDDGKVWLIWGSYAEGIYIRRIDPETGMPHKDYPEMHCIADAPDFMEAPYLVKRGDYYYLFVAMGSLKKTADYYWAVGRSKSLLGPYVDKDGNRMLSGNTSRLTEWKSGVEGAAHAQPFLDDDGQWYMVSEFWRDRSVATPPVQLHISKMVWNEAGWPVTALSSDLLAELSEK